MSKIAKKTTKMVPKIAKRSSKGTILGQDGAQDRQEEPQGDNFWAEIVPKIFGQAFSSKSDQKCESVAQNQNLKQLKWPKVCECCSKADFRGIIFRQKSPKVCEGCSKIHFPLFCSGIQRIQRIHRKQCQQMQHRPPLSSCRGQGLRQFPKTPSNYIGRANREK